MNVARGHVAFQAGGKDYTLALTTNAMVRYQHAAGETLLHALGKLQEDPSDAIRLRRLMWAALLHYGSMTEDDAGDLMDEVGIIRSVRLLSDASSLAFPDVAGDAGNDPKPPRKAATKKAATETM